MPAAAPLVSCADLAEDVFVDDEAAEELADFVAGALSADPESEDFAGFFAAGFFFAGVFSSGFVAGWEPLLLPAEELAESPEPSSVRPSK